MIIRWSPQARHDRETIWEYVAADDTAAAARLDEAFGAAASGLAQYAEIGRPGVIAGTRELFPVTNYRLVYEIQSQEIWILALVHTARRWPEA